MRRVAAGAAALLLAATTACGTTSSSAQEDDRELVVFAASSLRDVLAELAVGFERDRGVRVVVSAGGSSTLAQQVVAGAPADVLAAASPSAVEVVTEAGEVDGAPVVFARNRLKIAVPEGNPAGVRGLADLARPELDVALCAAQVPCGEAAERVFAAAGLEASPDTLEQDVRAVLTKVRLGEVDAGLVWVTDVRSAEDDVDGVAFAEAASALSDYPAVVLRGSDDLGAARDFVALLRSRDGQAALAAAGFAPPA